MRHTTRVRPSVQGGGRAPVRHAGDGAGLRAWPAAGSLPYLPGLDGLRALAVIAVLLYHGTSSFLPGGFIGVEIFFVISGYLITAVLLAQWRRLGRIDLKAFWVGRARRLLPALYLVLVLSLAYAVVFLPGEVAGLRGDVVAALGYVTNWYLVYGHESYFEAVGRPSLLKHLWSLAVEEQFYLLWPLVLALGLGLGATRFRRRRVLGVALAGSAISTALMAILYRPEVDPSRLYYGTDTRATGLLLGAALAFVWAPWRAAPGGAGGDSVAARVLRLQRVKRRSKLRRRWGWTAPMLLDLAGASSLILLALLSLNLTEFDPLLYRGGLLLVSLATVLVIMALAHPHSRLGTEVLGRQPLRWIGQRSYGIYLWHWPVYMVTRPEADVGLDGIALLVVRVGITLMLAELSYRYVEVPIRRGALGRGWKQLREAQGPERQRLSLIWGGGALSILAVCAVLGIAASQAREPEAPSYIPTKAIHTQNPPPAHGVETLAAAPTVENPTILKRAAVDPQEEPEVERSRSGGGEKQPGKDKDAKGAQDAWAAVGPVSAVGDSVMLGSVDALHQSIPTLTTVDAEVAFQATAAIDVLAARRARGELGEVVVVHIGTNGVLTAEQFDQTMQVLKGVRRVVFVNVSVPRPWGQPNNEVIAEGVRRYPKRAVLADWYSASADHPEYFVEDGIHLQIKGQKVYAALIAEKVKAR